MFSISSGICLGFLGILCRYVTYKVLFPKNSENNPRLLKITIFAQTVERDLIADSETDIENQIQTETQS